MANDSVSFYVFATKANERTLGELLKKLPWALVKRLTVVSPHADRQAIKAALVQSGLDLDLVEMIPDESFNAYLDVRVAIDKFVSEENPYKRSAGWYMQQYLKIAAVSRSEGLAVVIDGDTVLRPKTIEKMIGDKIIAVTKESVEIYNAGLALIGVQSSNAPYPSFVANFGLIDSDVLRDKFPEPDKFYIKWLEMIKANKIGDISEYQLFGTLMCNDGWRGKRINIFRRADLLSASPRPISDVCDQLLKRYDAVAFENHHAQGLFKKIAARVAVAVGYSW